MEENIKREFDAARLKHILFKARLRSFLYGSGTNDMPVRDPDVCPLGEWINTVALPQFGHLAEAQQLDHVHREVHREANQLLDLYISGRTEEALQGLRATNATTDKVLQLINTLERKLRKESR